MSSQNTSPWSMLVSLGVLGVVLYWAWMALSFMATQFGKLDEKVAAAVIVASGTVIVSVISVSLNKYYERQAEARTALWEKKTKMYEPFLGATFEFLGFSVSDESDSEEENRRRAKEKERAYMEALFLFNRQLLLWGGDDTLRQWAKFRMATGGEGMQNMIEFEKLVFELRREFGHSNKELPEGTVLRTFINDYDEAMAKATANASELESEASP